MPKERSFFSFVISAFALVGIVFSALAIQAHLKINYGIGGTPSLCSISEELSCEGVLSSRWAILFGIPLASYGFMFYLGIFLSSLYSYFTARLPLSSLRNIVLVLGVISSLSSIYLFYIAKFVIGSVCPICLGMYLANFLLLASAFFTLGDSSFAQSFADGVKVLLRWPRLILGFLGEGYETKIRDARALGFILFAVCVIIQRAPTYLEPFFPKEPVTLSGESVEFNLSFDDGLLSDHLKGDITASIQIVEFADLECPACRKFHQVVTEILAKHKGEVSYVMLNYPLSSECNEHVPTPYHQNACYGAEFARCAGEQGKYYEALDHVFTLEAIEKREAPFFVRAAINKGSSLLGLDVTAIVECMESDRQLEKIKSEIDLATSLKLTGTPTFWINGVKVEKASKRKIEDIIESLLSKASH